MTAGLIYFLLLFQLYVYQVMTKPSLWQMSNVICWGKTEPPQVFVRTEGLSMVLTWRCNNFQFSSFYLYSYNSQQKLPQCVLYCKIKILQQYRVNPNNQMPPVSKKNSLFLWQNQAQGWAAICCNWFEGLSNCFKMQRYSEIHEMGKRLSLYSLKSGGTVTVI